MIARSIDRAPASSRALDATSRAILLTDASRPDYPITYANAAFYSLTGYDAAEVIGRSCRFLHGPETDRRTVGEIRRALAAGVGIHCEIVNYRKDGTSFWNDLIIDPVHDAAGMLTGFIGMQADANAKHDATEAQAEAEARLDSIANHVPGYIYRRVMKPDGRVAVVYCSPSIHQLLGVANLDAQSDFYKFVHPDDLAALTTAIRNSAADMTIFREEFRLISADGTAHWLRSDAPPRRMKNGDIVWDGLAIEISAEKRWQTEIADLAMRDPLTGLLSREAWRQMLARQIENAEGDAAQCGILFADIDAFQSLNEQVGQRICDEVLRRTAQRVAAMAASVAGIAGRLGGDEFAVLIPECAGPEVLLRLAAALSLALAAPIEVAAQLYSITTSIGANLCTTADAAPGADEDATSEAMARSELALRWAKQDGAGSHVLYSGTRDDRFRNQAVLARSLEGAIRDGELELHYQPIVDLASGQIVSAEALVRWKHPTLGMQRPDLFIPLAEASGLIVPLGRWVIEQAMRQRSLWSDGGLAPPPIAINVSGIQLNDPDFVPFVAEALRSIGAYARDFEIELTEGQLIEASPHILASLHALRDMGFTIAIDDFGSGHATFRYLRDFPVDKLKIDQLFIRKLVLGSTDALIIRAIISLAQSMNIRVLAEGVETEMQRDFLQREGCEIGQGYLFSMPLVAEDFAWLLAGDVRLPLTARDDGDIAPAASTPAHRKGARAR